ncbi:hypothetical protein BH11ACT8_BH11ACT8_15760 [soil metagenome]
MTSAAFGGLCLLVPIAAVAIIVVAIVRSSASRKQRTTDLATYAAYREWRFSADGTGLESRFTGDPFGRGSRRRASNVIEGRFEGRPFLAFDYTYETGSGDDHTSHACSVLTMYLGDLGGPIPLLQVSPQGSVGRFFSRIFGNDFVVGDPPFDDAFLVRTDTPAFATDVLHPGMRALLASYLDRGWRFQGDSMLMFRSGRHTPQEIDAVLASMRTIVDQVPAHVWSRLRGEA